MIFRLLKVIADDARIGNKQSNLNDYLKGNMWQYVAICGNMWQYVIFRLLKVMADDARNGNKELNLNDYLKGNMRQYVVSDTHCPALCVCECRGWLAGQQPQRE